MPRTALELHARVVGHLRHTELTRRKMEKLFISGDVVLRDLNLVYAGLYLDAVTTFERLVEDLFIGLITGDIVHPSATVRNRIGAQPRMIARKVVYAGRSYVDWMPYDKTESRAKAFFTKGRPFTNLTKPEKKQLLKIVYIRNTLAHQSTYAERMFQEEVIKGLILTSRERTAAGFLRSVFAVAPTQTQFESLVGQLAAIALKLCS